MSTTERDNGRIAVGSRTVHPALVLAILTSANFISQLDVWITNVGLPAIGSGVGEGSLSNLSWVLSAYAITYAALLVPAGRLADRFGRKGGFLVGLTLFSVASLGAGLSSSVWVLVGFRVLQAAGAAVLTPSSLGLVLTSAPAAKVQKYVQIWVTTAALSATCGPLLGGVLITASWRWLFLVNLPVCLLALAGAARWVPNTRHEQDARLPDALGGALLIVGIGALALGAVEGADWGWSSARVITAFAVSALAIAAFVARSARHPAPVIQLSLLRDRVFSSANGAVLLLFASFSMVLLSVILWLQGHWHYSAITTGLATAPGPALVPIFAAIAEILQRKTRIPVGAFAALGLFLIGLGAILFALTLGSTRDYVDAFLPGWLTVGAGAGLAIPTLFSSATVTLAPEQTATGSAIVSMFQQIGAVIGISVLVAILGVASGAAGLHLFQAAWITSAALAAGGVILAIPTLFSSATVNLAPEQTATGSAIVSMFQQIGAVIGISVLVAILGVASGAAGLHLFQAAWITAAALAAGGVSVALGITPRRTAPALASVDRDVEPEPQSASA